MKCTFYRTKEVNMDEWVLIRQKLYEDLKELDKRKTPEREVIEYLEELLPQAEPAGKNPAMRFFGFEKPENLPSEERVEFCYWPTYLAAAFTIESTLLYPGILERVKLPGGQKAEEIFGAVLTGCTGRGFRGHGVDDVKGLVEVTEFFTDHGAVVFLARNKSKYPEFEECFRSALMFLFTGVATGKVAGTWGDDYTERAEEILDKVRIAMQILEIGVAPRLYLAYGSNLNREQMKYRCPDAWVLGTAELQGWRLMFKGSMTGNYLTIEQEPGFTVPVAVWAISERDEMNLDRYEGYPNFYYKKELEVELHDLTTGATSPVTAFAYIMHEDRKLGCPAAGYVETCMEGYRNFGFDERILAEAYRYSREA